MAGTETAEAAKTELKAEVEAGAKRRKITGGRGKETYCRETERQHERTSKRDEAGNAAKDCVTQDTGARLADLSKKRLIYLLEIVKNIRVEDVNAGIQGLKSAKKQQKENVGSGEGYR
eukprot:2692053-Pleurochrysis_carterae.AAC.1